MDSVIDLNGTWKDCERHIEKLTLLVRQILSGEQGIQQTASSLLERLELLKASCCLAKGQSDLLTQREKEAVRAVQTQAAASVAQIGQPSPSHRMAQVGSHAYVPSMLQTGSQQLQVLTPTSNVLLTGGGIPGQGAVQAIQTCTVDASQISPQYSSLTTSQPVSYIVPSSSIRSTQLAQLHPSQASSLDAAAASRILQIQHQPQQQQHHVATSLPATLAGISTAGLGALSYLQGSTGQVRHNNLMSASAVLPRHHMQSSDALPAGASRVLQSAFSPPAESLHQSAISSVMGLSGMGPSSLHGSKRAAEPSDHLQALKRARETITLQLTPQHAKPVAAEEPLAHAQQLPASTPDDVKAGAASAARAVGGVMDREGALKMLAGAALSPFASVQDVPMGRVSSPLGAGLTAG